MSGNSLNFSKKLLQSEFFSVIMGLVALFFVVGSFSYNGDAQKFPFVVGICTILITFFDVSFNRQSNQNGFIAVYKLRYFMSVLGWFTFTLGLIYFFGLVFSAIVSAAIYARAFIKKSLVWCLFYGVTHGAFIYLVFQELAGFRLYRGLIW